ncbi:MAG: hypothetical protein OXI38_14400 [Bacteroidota bacterium]|nr:hypothetical protein [Bacteroidota bacterium]
MVLALAGALCGVAQAQVSPSLMDYARPALNWYTIETEHFNVLFHMDSSGTGASRSARVVARIAEEVYGPITSLYGYEPVAPIHIILKDYEDYSNGAAYFFDNKIEIWAPALDSRLRGAHDWLRNVITHEFTHIVQVQRALKAPLAWPFAYLQILGYEKVRRPDVLYGFPNAIISYPLSGLNNPAWLAEGTAQFQRDSLHYDRWDSHRDMMLRTRMLARRALSLTELGSFYSKSSLMREGVYNHGYAFSRYLARQYGEEVLALITEGLSSWPTVRVERALRRATGIPGRELYNSWVEELTQAYAQQTAGVTRQLVAGRIIEPAGFANYYPVFAPDGTRMAYVSNQDEHYSRLSLYVRDLEDGSLASYDLGHSGFEHLCAFGHKVKSAVIGGASWHPDGRALVYVRQRTDPHGYLHNDLYELDLATEESRRLTHGARAAQPAWSPDGLHIAYVSQQDGTTNLMRLTLETQEIVRLTDFADGTQIADPAWGDSGLYFSRLDPGGHDYDIWHLDADGARPLVDTPADERFPTPGFNAVYYTSDTSGIANIYRIRDGISRPLTRVLGGAFMPSVRADGALIYAHYQWDGYKIAMLDRPVPLDSLPAYSQPAILRKSTGYAPGPTDADVAALSSAHRTAVHSDGAVRISQDGDSLTVSPYGAAFTPFSAFPVLRLDQYVSRRMEGRVRGRGETLWRNLKIGSYVSSREILEGISLFGGLLVGPGSRESSSSAFLAPDNLLALERDVFLQFEYRKGFGVLPWRWSPQVALEVYNIQRRVQDGLIIEEFPCTACLPDSTATNLTYGLWEGDIYLRSKVASYLAVELGYRYSPYRVNTDQFYSRELQQTVPGSSSRYFIGRSLLFNAYFEARRAHRESDIMPTGLTATLSFERELGRLLDRFEIRSGQLSPVYSSVTLNRLTLDARAGFRLPGRIRQASHGLAIRVRISTSLGRRAETFYNDYIGGLSGVRGYPFYGLGGTETIWMQTSWAVPIAPDIRRQIGPVYFDKAFAKLYADVARVGPDHTGLRRDAGLELRLKMGSYYLLPTALFVSATYGLDRYDLTLDEAFVSDVRQVQYGRELLWHFGVLFGFDL